MKTIKRLGRHGLAAFMALAMCAGLTAPAFAATVLTQGHFRGGLFVPKQEEIAAAGGKNGTLEYELGEDGLDLGQPALFKNGWNVSIDLNGQTLTGGLSISAANVTITDSSEEQTGTITGSKKSGVTVQNGQFAMTGGTITGNGSLNTDGGGIKATSSNVTLTNVTIEGNTGKYGGGIYSSGAVGTVSLDNVTIQDNDAWYGGGIYANNGTVSLEDTTIEGNTAFYGGGIEVTGNASLDATGGKITNNTSNYYGGGIHAEGVDSTLTDVDISGNTAGYYGGGVCVLNGGTLDVNGGSIEDNTAGTGGNYGGGGLAVFNASNYPTSKAEVTINGTTIDGNYKGTGDDKNQDDALFFTVGDAASVTVTIDGETIEVNKDNRVVTENGINAVEPEKPGESEKPEVPVSPVTPEQPYIPDIEIDDSLLPLAAGPVTHADFIDYLYRYAKSLDLEGAEGIPEALAGLYDGEDRLYQRDDLVSADAARKILTVLADYLEVEMPELATLAEESEEILLNANEVAEEFFAAIR